MTIEEAMKKCQEIIHSIGGDAEWITEDCNPIELHTNIAYNEDNEAYLMTEADYQAAAAELWGEN
jgi:hypothetical protein